MWNKLLDSFDALTVIFVESSFDFIRLKSFFTANSVAVAFAGEEMENDAVRKSRSVFEKGKRKFLLVSERAIFYQVCFVKKN